MSVNATWDNEDRSAIRTTLHDQWTWEELYAVNKDLIGMMRSTDQSVHLMLDFTQVGTIPAGGVIMHLHNLLTAYPSNCGLRIIITDNALVQRLIIIFQAAFQTSVGKYVHCVTTLGEAQRLIDKQLATRRSFSSV